MSTQYIMLGFQSFFRYFILAKLAINCIRVKSCDMISQKALLEEYIISSIRVDPLERCSLVEGAAALGPGLEPLTSIIDELMDELINGLIN